MALGLAVARRIVLAPPWILSVLMLMPSFLVGLLVPLPNFEALWRTLNLLLLAIDLAWIWSVYTVSVAATPGRKRPSWAVWIFALPFTVSLIATAANLSMENSLPALLFFAAFLFCLGQTAMELETADQADKPITTSKTLGTVALLFFSPVGVWWLRQRLLRIAARTANI